MLEETLVSSAALGRNRAVWVDSSDGHIPGKLCVILDAESYLCNVVLGAILSHSKASGDIGPMTYLFVPFVTPETRHFEYACHEGFSRFLVDDLMTWARERFPSLATGGHAIMGLSLSGLQAAFTALRHPGVFNAVVCQSPSAWYRDEFLRDQVDPSATAKADFRISVGSEETTSDVVHEPGELHQKASQIDSCRRLSEALTSAGHAVDYSVFDGSHDSEFWAEEMPDVLKWIWERVRVET